MMQSVKLNQVCKILNGYAFKSEEYQSEGVPLLRISNFDGGDVVVDDKSIYVDQSFLKTKTDFIVEKGDILIALSGATTGKYGIYNHDFPSLLNQRIGLIKSSASSKLSGKYFYHFLNILKDEILRKAGGAAQPNISTKTIGELEIPLPPLPQQQKIANILDAADALRQNDKALIAKYDELTQVLFLDLFGDPVSNPKGWKFKALNQLVSKLGDGLHGTPKYSEDGEYYFVNGNNLDNGKITISENTKRVDFSEYEKHKKDLNENTMLVSINGTIGKIAFYNNEKIILGKSACYFNLIKGSVNDIFLFHIFKSDYFLRYSSSLSTGSTIQNVSLKTMREFPIPIPPLELQNQFAERVAVIEEQKAIAQKSLEKSESLFNSLLQKAFKGELV